jgi:hypothetical protein
MRFNVLERIYNRGLGAAVDARTQNNRALGAPFRLKETINRAIGIAKG